MANNPYPGMLPPIYSGGKVTPQAPFKGPNYSKPAPNTSGMSNDPMNDAGGGNQASTATSVKAMQQFLKNRGYNIAIDGVRGPETNAAVLAFHKKVAPASFNSGRGGKTPVVSTPPTPTNTTPVTPPATNSGGGKSAPAPAPAPAATPYSGLIDPAAYAKGTANAQFDPQINELIRQITQGKADEGSHAKQIQDWFNQALGVQSDMAKSNADAGQQAEQGYNDANANVLDLFGGPNSDKSTASEAAAFHDIGAGNLAADVNAQGQLDKNFKSIEALKGAEAQKSQFNADQQGLRDMAGKLIDLRGAKGSAYASAYQQGQQNRTQQEAAQQALKTAQLLAPAQVATANANATVAKTNAASAAATSKTNLAIAQARLKEANAKTQQALAGNGGHWDLTSPQQQGAFQKALETNIFGPRGGLALNPDTAWANLQQQLKMNGLANDPHAQQLAQGTFLQGLWTSHSLGNFGGFAWNGKKIVRTGNSYKVDKTGKRSLVNSKGVAIPDYKPYNK